MIKEEFYKIFGANQYEQDERYYAEHYLMHKYHGYKVEDLEDRIWAKIGKDSATAEELMDAQYAVAVELLEEVDRARR